MAKARLSTAQRVSLYLGLISAMSAIVVALVNRNSNHSVVPAAPHVFSASTPPSISPPQATPAELYAAFDRLTFSATSQSAPMWGWAAGIASILAYKGILITPSELGIRTHHGKDDVPNEHWFSGTYRTASGKQFTLDFSREPIPAVEMLLKKIAEDEPFLIILSDRAYLFHGVRYKVSDRHKTITQWELADVMSPRPTVVRMSSSELYNAQAVYVRIATKEGP